MCILLFCSLLLLLLDGGHGQIWVKSLAAPPQLLGDDSTGQLQPPSPAGGGHALPPPPPPRPPGPPAVSSQPLYNGGGGQGRQGRRGDGCRRILVTVSVETRMESTICATYSENICPALTEP